MIFCGQKSSKIIVIFMGLAHFFLQLLALVKTVLL